MKIDPRIPSNEKRSLFAIFFSSPSSSHHWAAKSQTLFQLFTSNFLISPGSFNPTCNKQHIFRNSYPHTIKTQGFRCIGKVVQMKWKQLLRGFWLATADVDMSQTSHEDSLQISTSPEVFIKIQHPEAELEVWKLWSRLTAYYCIITDDKNLIHIWVLQN